MRDPVSPVSPGAIASALAGHGVAVGVVVGQQGAVQHLELAQADGESDSAATAAAIITSGSHICLATAGTKRSEQLVSKLGSNRDELMSTNERGGPHKAKISRRQQRMKNAHRGSVVDVIVDHVPEPEPEPTRRRPELEACAIKIQTRWRHRNDASISNALSQLVEMQERTLHDLGVTSLDKVDKTAIQAAIASRHNMSTGELDKDRAQHQGDEEMSVFVLMFRLPVASKAYSYSAVDLYPLL